MTSTTVVRTVRVDIDSRGAVRGGNEASKALRQVGQTAEGASNPLEKFNTLLGGLAAGLGGIAASFAGLSGISRIIELFRGFDTSIAAAAQKSAEGQAAFDDLASTARRLGATTSFSAAQAADSLLILVSALGSAEKALNAVQPTLTLAVAGQLELADSATILLSSLSQFGVGTEEAGRFADVLVQGANQAATDVQQLGAALSFVGSTARLSNLRFEETVAALDILADAALKGSRGGNSLRAVLNAVAKPTSEFRKVVAETGITVGDLDVRTRGLVPVLESLKGAFNVDQLNRAFTVEQLAGVDALLQRTDDLTKLTKQLDESSGVAETFASVLAGRLDGSLKGFNSAVEELLLTIGEDSGLIEGTKNLVDFGTEVLRVLAGVKGAAEEASPAVRGTATALQGLGLVLGALTISATLDAINKINTQVKGLPGLIQGVVKALGPLAAVLGSLLVAFAGFNVGKALEENVEEVATTAAAFVTIAQNIVDRIIGAVKIGIDLLKNLIFSAYNDLISGLPVQGFTNAVAGLFDSLGASSGIGAGIRGVGTAVSAGTRLPVEFAEDTIKRINGETEGKIALNEAAFEARIGEIQADFEQRFAEFRRDQEGRLEQVNILEENGRALRRTAEQVLADPAFDPRTLQGFETQLGNQVDSSIASIRGFFSDAAGRLFTSTASAAQETADAAEDASRQVSEAVSKTDEAANKVAQETRGIFSTFVDRVLKSFDSGALTLSQSENEVAGGFLAVRRPSFVGDRDSALSFDRLGEDVGESVGQNFGKALEAGLLDGASFESVAETFVRQLQRDLINALVIEPITEAVSQLFSALVQAGISAAGAAGGSFSGAGSAAPTGSAQGNVFRFARGGVIPGLTRFPMNGGGTGEAGETNVEGILPLSRDRQGRLGVIASDGGGLVVNASFNFGAGTSVDEFRRSESRVAAVVGSAINRARSRSR